MLAIEPDQDMQKKHNNGLDIRILVGSHQQLIKFLIDMGVQHSVLMQWDPEKLCVWNGKVEITKANGSLHTELIRVIYGEKWMPATHFAIKGHSENILGSESSNLVSAGQECGPSV